MLLSAMFPYSLLCLVRQRSPAHASVSTVLAQFVLLDIISAFPIFSIRC